MSSCTMGIRCGDCVDPNPTAHQGDPASQEQGTPDAEMALA